jgi:predicted RecA/RadA family phage recombinase
MATELELVPFVTPQLPANTDLRTHQRKFVQITPTGVGLADVRSGGTAFVLATAPGSGEPAALISGPNIPKVIAGEAITIGQCVQPMSASGLAGVTSAGNAAAVGMAWATAAGSGEYIPVKLWK